jgi:hypothetical protein
VVASAPSRSPSPQPPALLLPRRYPSAPAPGPDKKKPAVQKIEREPDEIQIHIGRIEVTAVQPAPAPTPARLSRKTPSLDEYLRRRDRRNS